jgi:alpha-L-rhamnosidase
MNSFNHYAFGSIGQWLMSGVLGIMRDESDFDNVGFRKFILNPQYGGTLTYAKGHYDSVAGRIESSWERKPDGVFEYRFVIPENTQATVYMPAKEAPDPVDVGEGATFIRYDAAAQRAVYAVKPGTYHWRTMSLRT